MKVNLVYYFCERKPNSNELIEVAKKSFEGVEFRTLDMRNLRELTEKFDFVYSSLALHYVSDWRPVLNEVRNLLNPNGTFLFSVQHPIYWGSEVIMDDARRGKLLGYLKNNADELNIYGDYLSERQLKTVKYGSLEVATFNKSISKMFQEIRESGFQIIDFLEPQPVIGAKEVDELHYGLYSRIPIIMVIELKEI